MFVAIGSFPIITFAQDAPADAAKTEAEKLFAALVPGQTPQAIQLIRGNRQLATARGPNGVTPLHRAVRMNHRELIMLLLKRGADIHAKDNQGNTPLHYACENVNADVAQLLCALQADPDIKSDRGKTPLHFAVERKFQGAISAMIVRTKQLDFTDSKGNSLLHIAVSNNDALAVEVLLTRDIDPNAANDAGETPLHLAAWGGNVPMCARLVAAGASGNAKDESGQTPVHGAAWQGHADVIYFLNAAPTKEDRVTTPVHAAAWQGHTASVAALLSVGYSPNTRNSDGATALHRAAWRGHGMIVQALLANGGDASIKDDNGMTALDLAQAKLKESKTTFTKQNARAWGPEQAIGPPDTSGFGDQQTAWASASADAQAEWLVLSYEKAVVPSFIEVHETCAPGALTRVTAFDEKGNEVELWKGKDPTPSTSQGGVSKVEFKTETKTNRVKIYLDCANVSGWNEIDAVSLNDGKGGKQWAIGVEASSTYASGPSPVSPHVEIVRMLKAAH